MKIKRLISLVLLGVMLMTTFPALPAVAAEVTQPVVEGSNFSKDSLIVAYFNATQSVSYEFTNIDVLNYHPATVTANAMSYTGGSIVTHSYTSRLSNFKAVARAQNPDIKFVFTVANGNINDFESWFTSAARARILADEMLNIIKTYGYDGLDIDYEFPGAGNNPKTNFVTFMKYMREGFDTLSKSTGKEYILSMAVPGTQWAFSLFKMNDLANYVDYFNIMNYDLYVGSATNGTTHHHTPPYDNSGLPGGSVYSDIQLYLENGIPADKIVPGCGLYSRRWTGVPNVNHGLYQSGKLDETNIHYTDIKANYVNKNGYVRYWDDNAKAPYLYNASKGIFLTYDDEQSVKIKCEIVAQQKVRGIMVFDYCTADGIGLFDSMRGWIDAASGSHEHSYTRTMTKIPGCVETGIITYTCECGDSYTEDYPAIGNHSWKDWVVTKEATETEDGEQQRTCRRGCGAVETEVIPATGTPVVEEPYLTSEGPNLTVHNLANVKDYFIATGELTTYRDVKDNMVFSITAGKLGDTTDYTYTLKEGGMHTVLIRYNDGTQKFLYTDINVTEPVFTQNGLQVKVSNLTGVKVIRTAYGEYNTVSDIKKAAGSRSFSAKNDIKDASEYLIQYRNSEVVTIAVQYTDGYTAIVHLNVQQKTPTFVQEGNKVTIGDLDDLYVVRYAQGEYTTASQIKAAAGSKALKADAAVDGYITIENLKAGTYTFCVQYTDESYNYYVITVE